MKKNVFLLLALLCLLAPTLHAQSNKEAEALVEAGIQLHDAGQYEAALEKYKAALKIDGDNMFALYESGNTYFVTKDYKKALKYAEKVADLYPGQLPDAYVLKGNCLDELGKPEKSIEAYQEGIRKCKPSFMLHFNLGVTLLKQEKSKDAAAEFIEALQINPSHGSSHYLLGLAYHDEGLKVKTLLPLYMFTLMESESNRSEIAAKTILKVAATGATDNGDNQYQINIGPNAMTDEYSGVELGLSLLGVSNKIAQKTLEDSLHIKADPKTAGEQLTDFNTRFFTLLDEISEKNDLKKGFWWDNYANFFIKMNKAGHTETFTHYILLNSGDKSATEWFQNHRKDLTSFVDWLKSMDEKGDE